VTIYDATWDVPADDTDGSTSDDNDIEQISYEGLDDEAAEALAAEREQASNLAAVESIEQMTTKAEQEEQLPYLTDDQRTIWEQRHGPIPLSEDQAPEGIDFTSYAPKTEPVGEAMARIRGDLKANRDLMTAAFAEQIDDKLEQLGQYPNPDPEALRELRGRLEWIKSEQLSRIAFEPISTRTYRHADGTWRTVEEDSLGRRRETARVSQSDLDDQIAQAEADRGEDVTEPTSIEEMTTMSTEALMAFRQKNPREHEALMRASSDAALARDLARRNGPSA
jgi:hypothetical protein